MEVAKPFLSSLGVVTLTGAILKENSTFKFDVDAVPIEQTVCENNENNDEQSQKQSTKSSNSNNVNNEIDLQVWPLKFHVDKGKANSEYQLAEDVRPKPSCLKYPAKLENEGNFDAVAISNIITHRLPDQKEPGEIVEIYRRLFLKGVFGCSLQELEKIVLSYGSGCLTQIFKL